MAAKKEIDIDSFVNIKASIPKAKVGTTSLKSEKQKGSDKEETIMIYIYNLEI